MAELKEKVDELMQVRETVNLISRQISIEKEEISDIRKSMHDTSLELKKVEDSFQSRFSYFEEQIQSIGSQRSNILEMILTLSNSDYATFCTKLQIFLANTFRAISKISETIIK